MSKCLSYYLSHLSDTSECSDTWRIYSDRARFIVDRALNALSPGDPIFWDMATLKKVARLSGLSGSGILFILGVINRGSILSPLSGLSTLSPSKALELWPRGEIVNAHS